jgi:hypothetical protein|tara:strand:+ start:218 stop:604 length:387 start_codon:yes stop_codon:yes gene_type:complete
MARFIKFPLTAASGATGSDLLINIDDIAYTTSPSTTTTAIFLKNSQNTTRKWVVTHLAPVVANAVLTAISKAIAANPGGYVSTVGSPVSTAQVPASQGGGSDGKGQQGRTVVTTAQANVTYTSAAFTN